MTHILFNPGCCSIFSCWVTTATVYCLLLNVHFNDIWQHLCLLSCMNTNDTNITNNTLYSRETPRWICSACCNLWREPWNKHLQPSEESFPLAKLEITMKCWHVIISSPRHKMYWNVWLVCAFVHTLPCWFLLLNYTPATSCHSTSDI